MQAEIPDAMIEEQARQFAENFRRQIQSQGMPYDQYMKMTGMDEEKLLAEAKGPAERQVRLDLTVAAIIEAEKLDASEEEIEAEFAKLAEQYGMPVENLKQYMDAAMVKDQIVSRKAIELVVDSAVAVKPEEPAEEAPAETEEKPKKKTSRKKKAEAEEAPTEDGEA